MDEIENAIITKLVDGKGVTSTEIWKAVREKTKIKARQTYQTRLRNLRENGKIRHKNGVYSLPAPRYRRDYLQSESRKLRIIEKKVDSLQNKENKFSEGYKLLNEIFSKYYFSLEFDLVCREKSLSIYEKRKMQDMKNWCQKMIKGIVIEIQKTDKFSANNLLIHLENTLKIS